MQLAGYSKVDELEIPPNRDSLDEVVKLCNSYLYRSMYDHKFWERQFKENRTFLMRKQNNATDWANELLYSVACMKKARTIFSDFQNGKDCVVMDLNSVNKVDIFPDFLDGQQIHSILLCSRANERTGQIILKNHLHPKIVFEALDNHNKKRKYNQKLTDDQTFYLLFLFCYYGIR
nr:hypothetical protein Cduv_400 [Cedratvirus duvanny]